MMASLEKPKVFIITYDDGEDGQVLRVSHKLYHSYYPFQKYIKHTKCLDCNLEFNFSGDEKL